MNFLNGLRNMFSPPKSSTSLFKKLSIFQNTNKLTYDDIEILAKFLGHESDRIQHHKEFFDFCMNEKFTLPIKLKILLTFHRLIMEIAEEFTMFVMEFQPAIITEKCLKDEDETLNDNIICYYKNYILRLSYNMDIYRICAEDHELPQQDDFKLNYKIKFILLFKINNLLAYLIKMHDKFQDQFEKDTENKLIQENAFLVLHDCTLFYHVLQYEVQNIFRNYSNLSTNDFLQFFEIFQESITITPQLKRFYLSKVQFDAFTLIEEPQWLVIEESKLYELKSYKEKIQLLVHSRKKISQTGTLDPDQQKIDQVQRCEDHHAQYQTHQLHKTGQDEPPQLGLQQPEKQDLKLDTQEKSNIAIVQQGLSSYCDELRKRKMELQDQQARSNQTQNQEKQQPIDILSKEHVAETKSEENDEISSEQKNVDKPEADLNDESFGKPVVVETRLSPDEKQKEIQNEEGLVNNDELYTKLEEELARIKDEEDKKSKSSSSDPDKLNKTISQNESEDPEILEDGICKEGLFDSFSAPNKHENIQLDFSGQLENIQEQPLVVVIQQEESPKLEPSYEPTSIKKQKIDEHLDTPETYQFCQQEIGYVSQQNSNENVHTDQQFVKNQYIVHSEVDAQVKNRLEQRNLNTEIEPAQQLKDHQELVGEMNNKAVVDKKYVFQEEGQAFNFGADKKQVQNAEIQYSGLSEEESHQIELLHNQLEDDEREDQKPIEDATNEILIQQVDRLGGQTIQHQKSAQATPFQQSKGQPEKEN